MSVSASPSSTTTQREHFEALARNAERAMNVSLPWYRMKVALLALLGYAVIFGILAVLLTIIALCIWTGLSGYAWVLLLKAKLILVFPALGLVLLRALWVRIEAPKGYQVFRKDCPRLFDELSGLCRRLKAPRIHRVLIVNDFNVSIAQIPRLGIFGWSCNYLILGVPLLFELSSEQARAVLAHEIGHLSGNHSRFGAWIYRVRLSWLRIVVTLTQADNWTSTFLVRFFNWYAPYFSAYSFALARANEYEADSVAASLTSPQTVGAALVAVSALPVLDLERYWDPLFKKADHEPQAPRAPWSNFAEYAKQRQIDPVRCGTLIAQCMAKDTTYADTHPSLHDRLRALRTSAELEYGEGPHAAEEWLSSSLGPLLAEFDRQWLQVHEEAWRQRFTQVQTMKAQLAELEHKDKSLLTQEDRWNVIVLREQFDPGFDPLPAYRQYQAEYPHDRTADLSIGRLLLNQHDETGLHYLTRAAEEFRLASAACRIVSSYATSTGNNSLAEEWRLRAEQHYDLQIAGQRERAALSSHDELKQTSLSGDALAELQHQLCGVKHLQYAWICEKAVSIVPMQPLYVLAVEPKGLMYRSKEKELLRILTSNIRYPSETFVILTSGDGSAMAERVKALGVKVI